MDPYCPPLMVPLLHGLSLLQNVVQANRVAHFQPSTACIISCVRSILDATGTLKRDAPVLQRFAALADERRRILTILASFVAQTKKASEANLEADTREGEVENMLRLGGQVFSHVRAFLAVAVKCGIELPEDQNSAQTITPGIENFPNYGGEDISSPVLTPTQNRERSQDGTVIRPMRLVGSRPQELPDPANSPNLTKTLARARREQYFLRTGRHKTGPSVGSVSSMSSFSSQDSISPPPFPCGPSSAAQVMEALRFTHDRYLSTIAAFIGNAHSHSRTSHASSTGVLYDLVKEIVEMVCKLLTLVEAVMQHPDVPGHRVGDLKAAKEGLYNVTSSLAESVRLLTLSLPPTMSEDAEKQILLRSATGALKAGSDCVAAVKICLNRSLGERLFIVNLPDVGNVMAQPFNSLQAEQASNPANPNNPEIENGHILNGTEDEDLTIQATTAPSLRKREISSGSEHSSLSKSSWVPSDETHITAPEESKPAFSITIPHASLERDLPSPTSPLESTVWEGSIRGQLGEKIIQQEPPLVPLEPIPEYNLDPSAFWFGHDYLPEDVALNSEGHLVGATMEALVEKMTPHDSIVDPAFSAVFFMTFRLFSTPSDLVDAIISRYNLLPPCNISEEDLHLWQQRKGIPVRLRVSNFIKMWVEFHWRPGVDDVALSALTTFTRDGLGKLFQGPANRILDLLSMRKQSSDPSISPKADRSRDPGMSINPPTVLSPKGEIPRPTMTKTLLVSLRKKDFANISVTDFDALELSRQLTIMECNLYCAIQPEEILETGQEGAKSPVNVRAVSSLSTAITGWVAESILSEPDIKKRTVLVKFFVKVAEVSIPLPSHFTTCLNIICSVVLVLTTIAPPDQYLRLWIHQQYQDFTRHG